MTPTPEVFAALCFAVAVQNCSDRYVLAHPEYIHEKMYLLKAGYGAIAGLNEENRRLVRTQLETWGYYIPPEVNTIVELWI